MPTKFQGRTKAYGQFTNLLWRTRSLIDLGTVGIDLELKQNIDPLLAKLVNVKGISGKPPKSYEASLKSTKLENEGIQLEMDLRSAYQLKRIMENFRKDHDELRYFHYANLTVALWAAFESYNATLLEQLYRERPELLKSSEQIQIKDAIDHRTSILDFLIERQLEIIGHSKLKDILEYYRKRLGIEVSDVRVKKLEKYYFLRNVVAHKTGLVRPTQKLKTQGDFYVVGEEIRISKTFLLRMATLIESTVRFIESKVIEQFYEAKSDLKALKEKQRPQQPRQAK